MLLHFFYIYIFYAYYNSLSDWLKSWAQTWLFLSPLVAVTTGASRCRRSRRATVCSSTERVCILLRSQIDQNIMSILHVWSQVKILFLSNWNCNHSSYEKALRLLTGTFRLAFCSLTPTIQRSVRSLYCRFIKKFNGSKYFLNLV